MWRVMIKKLPFQLLLAVIIAIVSAQFLPLNGIRFFFSVSCFIKEILMAFLPAIILSYIAASIVSLEKGAPLLVFLIMSFVVLSNALSVLVSYFVGLQFLPLMTLSNSSHLSNLTDQVTPLFNVVLPKILNPDKAMLSGILLGFTFRFLKNNRLQTGIFMLRNGVNIALKKTFIPVLPLYVFGFVLKMKYEGTLSILAENFGQVLLLSIIFSVAYIVFLYWVAANFSFKKAISFLKTMLPAGITGFSTMSSVAAMPVTLGAVEKNTHSPRLTQLVVPTTVNIHLMGDSLGIPLLGMAVLMLFGQDLPTFENYLWFVMYYCIAKFSAASVPGGGMIVILPVLQIHLGLSAEMTGLVATLYILQDSIFTSFNVMGNGAFALFLQKITKRLHSTESLDSGVELQEEYKRT
jgi:Na+/H+-dicarboxylate symporter